MIIARSRAVALLAATATAATLTGATAHSSAPSTTWDQACPNADPNLVVAEAPGWEGMYDAFGNRAGTCTIIRNTSPAILWISVQSPNWVAFLDGTRGDDPRGSLAAAAGAQAAGRQADNLTQQPVLRDGYLVIHHSPSAPYWIQAADESSQVKAEFAIQLTQFAYDRLAEDERLGRGFRLHRNILECATAANDLRNDLLAEGQPVTFDGIFNQLQSAHQTASACEPVYEAAKPPKVANALDTPQASNARKALQKVNSWVDEWADLIKFGKDVVRAVR
ncbi:hypothetical protein ACWD26_29505 [Streptomyces sp. NPDC002787]